MALRLDTGGYTIAAWIGIGVLVALAIAGWAMGKGWGGAGLAATAVAGAIFIALRSRLPALFSLLFVLAGVLNGLGWVFDFWERVPYFDPVTHAYTTFATALALGFLAYFSVAVHFRAHGAIFVLAIASFGLALGALWEIFEWTIDVKQSYESVVVDLIADTIGAVLAGLLGAWAVRSDDFRIRSKG